MNKHIVKHIVKLYRGNLTFQVQIIVFHFWPLESVFWFWGRGTAVVNDQKHVDSQFEPNNHRDRENQMTTSNDIS
jgi:hypothetical protein